MLTAHSAIVQVMDPKKTTNEKVKKDRKPDHTLISFFGDDSYGWFPKGRDIIPFDKNYDAKSKQPASKKVQHGSLCLLDIPILAAPLFQKCKNVWCQRIYVVPAFALGRAKLSTSQLSCLQSMQSSTFDWLIWNSSCTTQTLQASVASYWPFRRALPD